MNLKLLWFIAITGVAIGSALSSDWHIAAQIYVLSLMGWNYFFRD